MTRDELKTQHQIELTNLDADLYRKAERRKELLVILGTIDAQEREERAPVERDIPPPQ